MKSEMTDSSLLRSALTRLGVAFDEGADAFRLHGADMEGVTIDVATGEVRRPGGVATGPFGVGRAAHLARNAPLSHGSRSPALTRVSIPGLWGRST
jgi:hypothetical protein